MGDGPEVYHSYLLRVWRAGSAEAPSWRLLIEDVLSRERYGFTSLEELAAFLLARAGASSTPVRSRQDTGEDQERKNA
jgi:hypothetical protein